MSDILFEFESSDSIAQFCIWIIPFVGGGLIMLPFSIWGYIGIIITLIVVLVIVIGLRASIVIHEGKVVVRKTCFFITYKYYEADCVEDIWFGGDWGFEEGAMGVVVTLNGKDVHIGTSKNMRYLFDNIKPFALAYKKKIVQEQELKRQATLV
jgi:hypothetical protein